MRALLIFLSALVLASTLPLNAKVYTPRVTTGLLPDYTELGRFVNWHRWRGLPSQEKAPALWKFLINYENGLFLIPITTSTQAASLRTGPFCSHLIKNRRL